MLSPSSNKSAALVSPSDVRTVFFSCKGSSVKHHTTRPLIGLNGTSSGLKNVQLQRTMQRVTTD
jgi:hypothetical protein